MIAFLHTPVRRISAAIALSVLVHAIILWLPYFHLPRAAVELPPLTVRLEPRPLTPETQPAGAEPATTLARSAGRTATGKGSSTMPKMARTAATMANHPLPKRLQLVFAVYQGEAGSRTGEIRQQLDIRADRYTLTSERHSAGLHRLSDSGRTTQSSSGRINSHGLQPDSYDEDMVNRDGTRHSQAMFDWKAQTIRYSDGSTASLPADTQDMLSFMYQLSQIPMNAEFVEMPVSDGERLQQYQIEIGLKQDLATPLGKLRVLYLRKIHTPGEPYFEIWLGLQYRLLPVKFRLVDGSDQAIEEYLISDIRAGDK